VTLRGTGLLPDDDLLRSKNVRVPLNIFMYFNIEINILTNTVLNVKKCICWCLSIIELKNAQ